MKKCPRCKQDKQISDFYKSKTAKTGLQSYCISCTKASHKAWSAQKEDELCLQRRLRYKAAIEGPKFATNEIPVSENMIQKALEDYDLWIAESRLKRKIASQESKAKNKEARLARKIEYDKKWRESRASDPTYRVRRLLRIRLNTAAKRGYRSGSAIRDLGCTIEELKLHLESKFQPGMTWDNYGKYGWHIDHVVPLSSFDLTDPEQLQKACHYTNLQPLWAKDNLTKSNKV
jgi:hypothetical protein